MTKISRTARKPRSLKNNTTTTKKESPRTIKKEQDLSFAEKSVVGSGFDVKTKGFKNTRIDVNTINRWLQDPAKNYLNLQNLSGLYYSTSGIYASLIDYYATLPKFYYTIIPISSPLLLLEERSSEDIKKDFYENSLKCQKLKIRENCYKFAKDIFIDGEGYYYKIEDSKGVIYQKFPNEYCLPYAIENDIVRFALNMEKVKGDDIVIYPAKIQSVIEQYKSNPKSDIFVGNYYPIGKEGVCFSTNIGSHGFPMLSKIFDSILTFDNKKQLQDSIDKINNTKMIHNEIPSDKDGKPIIPIELAIKFNDAIKTNLIEKGIDEGIFSATNPLKAQLLNLDTGANKNVDSLTQKALSSIYDEMGVSEMLFNSAKGGSEALKKSVIVDTAKVLISCLHQFEAYFTSELQNAKGRVKYGVKMLENTWFNEQDKIKESKEQLAYGGSVKVHYANLGFTPLETVNLIEEENILGFKDKLTPIQTSHTQSNTESSSGRPDADEMKDNGQEVSDVTERKDDAGGDYE